MRTRRQLKELFKNIAESHKQINSFGWGDVPEILSRQDHIYPLMMVTPSDVINEQGQIKHTYIISVADRLKKDISNQVDVDNDTQQIMADLIAIFYNIAYQNLSVELPLNITPFKNIDPQDVIGWYGTFSLIVDENYDYCAVPSEPIPFDPDPPFDCAPAFYRVQYEDGELIQEGTVVSGGSVTVNVPVCPESGSVEWELRDEDNNLLDSGTQPAGIPLTITAPDGLITIKDTDDGVLYVVNINSGGSVNQTINDSTVNINKSDSVLISAQTVKAEGVENYNVADSVITLNNTVPTLISTTNVKATDPATIVAPDAEISLNGVKMEDIPSNTSSNISVRRQTGSFQVGSKQGVHWRIANGTLNVNKSDGSLISARTLAAEETTGYNVADSVAVLKDTLGNTISSTNIKATESEDIVAPDATFNLDNTSGATLFLGSIAAGDNETIIAPDGDIENSDASYTASVESGGVLVLPDQTIEVNTVNEGSIPSVGTIEIDITDGVNPVTPNDVTIVGRKVTVEVPSGGGSFDLDLVDRFGNAFPTKQVTANANWDLRTLTPFDYADIFLNTLTGTYTAGEEQAIIDFVEDLHLAGIWERRRAIFPFVGGNAFDNSLNLKYPFANQWANQLRFFGSPTHDSNGVTMGATSMAYLIENAVWLPKQDFNLFFYSRTNSTPASGLFLDVRSQFGDGDSRFLLGAKLSDGLAYFGAGQGLLTVANADSRGGYHGNSVVGFSASKLFKNGSSLGTLTSTNYAGENLSPICLGGQLSNYRATGMALPTERNYAGFALGLGMTDTQCTDDYDIWQQFQTDFNGRQV
jgi:hypothetical protein